MPLVLIFVFNESCTPAWLRAFKTPDPPDNYPSETCAHTNLQPQNRTQLSYSLQSTSLVHEQVSVSARLDSSCRLCDSPAHLGLHLRSWAHSFGSDRSHLGDEGIHVTLTRWLVTSALCSRRLLWIAFTMATFKARCPGKPDDGKQMTPPPTALRIVDEPVVNTMPRQQPYGKHRGGVHREGEGNGAVGWQQGPHHSTSSSSVTTNAMLRWQTYCPCWYQSCATKGKRALCLQEESHT